MFTGIIQAVGHIDSIQAKSGDLRLSINVGKLPMDDVQLGDSIAVNGVCLTVIDMTSKSFVADVSQETMRLTSLGQATQGYAVNLEKALTLSTRLGGHLVSGHVDGLGQVLSLKDEGRSIRFRIKAPDQLAKYIAAKGSICVDGVSLTVNDVHGAEFDLNIVPHTLQETIIKHYQAGCEINLEVDVVARYLERLLLGEKAADSGTSSSMNEAFLAQHGFLKIKRKI